MTRRERIRILVVAGASIAACGGSSGTRQSAAASTGPTASTVMAPPSGEVAVGSVPPEFPAGDAAHWINGSPMTLASAHGDVVLVESWHRL